MANQWLLGILASLETQSRDVRHEKRMKIQTGTILAMLVFVASCASQEQDTFSPHPKQFSRVALTPPPKPPPLHDAVRSGSTNTVLSLVAEGADIDCVANPIFQQTPLIIACQKDDLPMAALLLKHGANVNAIRGDGVSPLHAAIENGDLALVVLLIGAGANVNLAGGRTYWTPLHVAVQKRNNAIVEILLEHGANVMLKNHNRQTPLDLAVRTKQKELEELLRNSPTFRALPQKGATPKTEDTDVIINL